MFFNIIQLILAVLMPITIGVTTYFIRKLSRLENKLELVELRLEKLSSRTTCPYHNDTNNCLHNLSGQISSIKSMLETLKNMGAFHSHGNGKVNVNTD